MKRFWTADDHLGNAEITRFCHRPWLKKGDLKDDGTWTSEATALDCADRSAKGIIRNSNSRVKTEDMVMCVGDFMNYGLVKGVPGLRLKAEDYLKQLNGTWIIIEGNHDRNNTVKTVARHMFVEIGGYRVFVSHYPTDNAAQDPELMAYVRKTCAFAICGHVHDRWQTRFDGILMNINVGLDVNKYAPIHDAEVLNIFEKARKAK